MALLAADHLVLLILLLALLAPAAPTGTGTKHPTTASTPAPSIKKASTLSQSPSLPGLPLDTQDADILCAFYDSITIPHKKTTLLRNWCGPKSPAGIYMNGPCKSDGGIGWANVTCTQGRVTALHLAHNNITGGSIPPTFGFLDALTHLDMSDNMIGGVVPSQLSGLASLTYLNLASNNFTGTITPALGQLLQLKYLSLSSPRLGGTLPSHLSTLSLLTYLSIQNTQVRGTIPSELAKLTRLEYLSLQFNLLSGPIPNEFGLQLKKLTFLSLSTNLGNPLSSSYSRLQGLAGTIPSSFGKLTNLYHLDLSQNSLTGTLPQALSALSVSPIQVLNIGGNSLIGTLHGLFKGARGNWTSLKEFIVSDCSLTGTIPLGVASMRNLSQLDLGYNSFTSTLPLQLSHLTKLTLFTVVLSSLSGTIPSWLGLMKRLAFLDLYGNKLTGKLPSSLGGLSGLTHFNLGSNQLSGTIPSSYCLLSPKVQIELPLKSLGCYPPCMTALLPAFDLDLENDLLGGGPGSIVACTPLFLATATLLVSGISASQLSPAYQNGAFMTAFIEAFEATITPSNFANVTASTPRILPSHGPGGVPALVADIPYSSVGTAQPLLQADAVQNLLSSSAGINNLNANFKKAVQKHAKNFPISKVPTITIISAAVTITPLPGSSPTATPVEEPTHQPNDAGSSSGSSSSSSRNTNSITKGTSTSLSASQIGPIIGGVIGAAAAIALFLAFYASVVRPGQRGGSSRKGSSMASQYVHHAGLGQLHQSQSGHTTQGQLHTTQGLASTSTFPIGVDLVPRPMSKAARSSEPERLRSMDAHEGL